MKVFNDLDSKVNVHVWGDLELEEIDFDNDGIGKNEDVNKGI